MLISLKELSRAGKNSLALSGWEAGTPGGLTARAGGWTKISPGPGAPPGHGGLASGGAVGPPSDRISLTELPGHLGVVLLEPSKLPGLCQARRQRG